MAAIGCRPNVALEIDGVPAILDLVRDGAGCAILSRNALLHSPRPSAFTAQPIGEPPLRIRLSPGHERATAGDAGAEGDAGADPDDGAEGRPARLAGWRRRLLHETTPACGCFSPRRKYSRANTIVNARKMPMFTQAVTGTLALVNCR